MSIIDENGYRANVAMVICNSQQQVLWAKRQYPADSWQFPQGGMKEGESLEQAMYRELDEEIGLAEADVTVLGSTNDWLKYDLPENLIRRYQQPLCIGQKQHWFLLKLISNESHICLTKGSYQEFTDWKWVDFDYPIAHVVQFKQDVYKKALAELKNYLT